MFTLYLVCATSIHLKEFDIEHCALLSISVVFLPVLILVISLSTTCFVGGKAHNRKSQITYFVIPTKYGPKILVFLCVDTVKQSMQ